MKSLPLWTEGPTEAVQAIARVAVAGGSATGYFVEAKVLHAASRADAYWTCLSRATWLFPDGVGAAWLSRRWGRPVAQRVSGPSLMLRVLEEGVTRGWRHYLLGGTATCAGRLTAALQRRVSGCQLVRHATPDLHPEDELSADQVCNEINASGADIVWVALGAPKQERWIDRHRTRLRAPVVLAVGAAFDFHAGTQTWAPPTVRRVGLEWLWRLATGPRAAVRRSVAALGTTVHLIARARPEATVAVRSGVPTILPRDRMQEVEGP